MAVNIKVEFCQCQNCIYCHGGGCGDEATNVIRFKNHNHRAEVAVCEMCMCSLLAAHPDEFEKVSASG